MNITETNNLSILTVLTEKGWNDVGGTSTTTQVIMLFYIDGLLNIRWSKIRDLNCLVPGNELYNIFCISLIYMKSTLNIQI